MTNKFITAAALVVAFAMPAFEGDECYAGQGKEKEKNRRGGADGRGSKMTGRRR